MKPYIDFLFEKKSYYKSIKNTGMSNTFKILANSLFGVMMTRVERFKNFKIVTNFCFVLLVLGYVVLFSALPNLFT